MVLMLSLAGACPVTLSMPVLTPTTGKAVAVAAGADCTPAHERIVVMQIAVLHIFHRVVWLSRGRCQAEIVSQRRGAGVSSYNPKLLASPGRFRCFIRMGRGFGSQDRGLFRHANL